MRTLSLPALSISLVLALTGCAVSDEGASHGPASVEQTAPSNPAGTGETVSTKIDNAVGGAVALSNGTRIEVPAGALPPGVDTITVTSSREAAPSAYDVVSPVFTFGPDGTVFLKPLKVSIPVTLPAGTATSTLTVLWSRLRSDGFDMVPSTFVTDPATPNGWIASAEVTHFSEGMVGKKFTSDPRPESDPYQ